MKKSGLVITTVLAVTLLLTACGGSKDMAVNTVTSYSNEVAEYDYVAGANVEELAEYDSGNGQTIQIENEPVITDRKLIKTVDLDVETLQYDALVTDVQNEINSLGGYIESMRVYNGSYGDNSRRNAYITARIPAQKLDAFVHKIGEEANITNRYESVKDVTLTYVDLESHKKMLQEEQKRLLELLESAESVEDIITIEGRLSEVRYQIESMESQLRTFDNQVDYSTVNLSIDEVIRLTPIEKENVWKRISGGFVKSLQNVLQGISNFFIGLIVAIPYLIVWGIVIVLAGLLIRLIYTKWRKSWKNKKNQDSQRLSEDQTSENQR